MRRSDLHLVMCAVLLTALCGCRRVVSPAPELTGGQLWRQAVEAMSAGDAEAAAGLFARSLEAEDDPDRRRDAAVRLYAAGQKDAARVLVADRPAPSMVALTRAMDLYEQAPPAGREDDPFVIGAIADALALLQREAALPAMLSPMLMFRSEDLMRAARLWQTWLWLAELEAPQPPDRPTRAMALWVGGDGMDLDALIDRGYIVHPPTADLGAGRVFHMGSWPLATTSSIADVVDIPAAKPGCLTGLILTAWSGDASTTLSVRATVTADGVKIRACSHPVVFEAIVATLNDPGLIGPAVTPSDDSERRAILALAERAGKLDAIDVDRRRLVPADARVTQTDYAPRAHWLADLAGYVRHGREAIAAAR